MIPRFGPPSRHRTPTRRGRAALLAALAIGLLGPTVAMPAAAGASGSSDEARDKLVAREPYSHERLAASLRDDLAAAPARPQGAGPDTTSHPVTVVVESSDPAASRRAVERAGGRVTADVADLLQAEVPAGALGALADAPSSRFVREPHLARPQAISEGVNETGANTWGPTAGAGTKVAVVDVGFAGYLTRLGTELPATVETDFTRCDDVPGSAQHGTAVAEVIHDVAPAASLLLVCINSDVEFAQALGTLAARGVKVVNGSIGFALTGRGDGSGGPGSPSGAVAALRRQGVLYVAAAGNYGLTHWNFTAAGDQVVQSEDPNLQFADLVDIDSDDALSFVLAPNGSATVSVSWDEWPNATTDFDAYVASDACPGVFGSADNQTTVSRPPVEAVEVVNCSGAFEVFELFIDRYNGTAAPRMDVFFDGAVAQVERTSTSSLTDPASSPAALAVGAHCYVNGALEPYSSAGPTIDGRTKPDISGPDSTSNSVYGAASGTCAGGFAGTSAATPHVVGAAADFLTANPALDVAELQQLLEKRALDSGAAGKDNGYGSGRLRLGAAGTAPAPTPRRLTPMTPLRLFDSRPGPLGAAEAAFGGSGRTAPIPANSEVAVQVAGIAGVPADATAVVLNVTATEPTASGWITVHPDGSVPVASNLNFVPGQTTAVHVTATVGGDDKVRFYNSHGSTHLVVDIAGWYGPTGSGNAGFTALAAPARAIDSRPGTPGFSEGPFGADGRTTPIGPDSEIAVQLTGLGGVPSGAKAVLVNLTVTEPGANGWLTLYPTGAPRPLASTLNHTPGLTVANLSVVPVSPDGRATIYNSHGTSHVVLDVIGYFTQGAGAGYVALDPPTRDLDSRTGTGPRMGALGPGATYKLEVARLNGVPARAAAVLLTVTAVFPSKAGWFTVYPGTAALPLASNLNFVAGSVVPNAVVSALGSDGTVAVNNAPSAGNTHVVSDLAGYFVAP